VPTFLSLRTTVPLCISRAFRDGSEQDTERFAFRLLCFSRAFCFWPDRTASVVPMMAGQAAMDVRIPSTMLKSYRDFSSLASKIIVGSLQEYFVRGIVR
jgi:hypothetical protein